MTARSGGRAVVEQDRKLIVTKDHDSPNIPEEESKQTMDKLYRLTPKVVGGGSRSGTTKIEKIKVTAGGPIAFESIKTKKKISKISVKPSASASIQIKKSPAPPNLNEKSASDEAFSTFSLHVSDVSFKLAQAALAKGEWPEASKVRIEEFVNAFDYDDAMPNADEKVACQMEQAIHPFLQQRNLLRVSMRTAAAGRSSQTPLRLTFLLDNSGSMERSDRQQTVRRAFALLTQQLQPMDQVTLISFARQPRLLADQVSGDKAAQLIKIVNNIPSEGGTNLEAALQLAFEKAQEQQLDRAQNRIIMLTDGAANLGDADPEHLARMIEKIRDSGIAFDAAGIGADGLNDEILEALTRKGDGRYYLLDRPENADQGFARQIAGALRPAAKNVKVQIEFNPKRVGRYKLLGYEKHRLKKEDFRNDQVDAAEMAAAEAGVAIYQFEAKPDGEGDVGSVSVRFRDLSTGQMIENRWPIPYQADAPRLDQAAPSLRIASTAALFAAKLKGDPLANNVDFTALSQLIGGLPPRQRNNKRVQQLQQMINVARASNP
ncbi:MAG: von Willebrand factor type A domain-containing protein [Verrucomicrobiales bacterium]|nr:von Willebrand factor type A domain-containing protein [Verrucomicrobiales bacterium]